MVDSSDLGSAERQYTLGKLHAAQGNARAAAQCFERALALDAAHAGACLSLADAFMDLCEYDSALATYRRALTLCSPFPEAHHNFAAALLHLGDAAEAAEQCRLALGARPGYVLALNTLGAALAKSGCLNEAIAALHQATQLEPGYAKAFHNLGNVLDQAGRREEARQAYRSALALNPALEEARYNLAALGEGPPPPAMPRPFLLRLFDTYATSFDQHLVETLDYHVPEMLYEAVMAAGAGTGLDVIDLGCGTGLVGQRFRGIARRLIGVDISPGMINQAQRRQVYDQLVLDDVAHYLNSRQEACDLVLAADVFIYIGDLAEIFQAVARLLRPGGLFAFSLESTAEADYVLQHNRRYAQSQAYIERLAGIHRLTVRASRCVMLRRHEGGQAAGSIVVVAAPEAGESGERPPRI
jgi:predicted TPR repeat methyltransferase